MTDSVRETAGHLVVERPAVADDTKRALFLIQNEDHASYYQERGEADEYIEIVVVSDLDAFIEEAVGVRSERPTRNFRWDLVTILLDPNAPEYQGDFDYCVGLCESIIAGEDARIAIVTGPVVESMPDVASITTTTKSSTLRTSQMRYEAWADGSHVSVIYSPDGSYQVLEIDHRRAESLLPLGVMFNENRFDFSEQPDLGGPRAPGSPWCCGVVWTACMGTTCSDLCGIMFLPCYFNWGDNPCHSMDGVCGACSGAPYRCFDLCNDPMCLPPNPWGCDC